MGVDVPKLTSDMIDAAKNVVADKWPQVGEYAESEFRKITESIATIENLKLLGEITEEQAQLHLEIQANASRMVLAALEGMSLIIAEQAINAALNVVKDVVNTTLGWKVIL